MWLIVDEAVTFAARAKSSGSSFLTPGMNWSSFRSACWSSLMRFAPTSRTERFSRTAIAAAVPVACPMVKIVPMMRVEPSAAWVTEMLRPAM